MLLEGSVGNVLDETSMMALLEISLTINSTFVDIIIIHYKKIIQIQRHRYLQYQKYGVEYPYYHCNQ